MSGYATSSVEVAAGARRASRAVMRTILAVVDPTIEGRQSAVNKAARIAAACGARLELYLCDVNQDVPESWAGPSLSGQYRDMRRQQQLEELRHLAAPLKALGQEVNVACEWHAPLEEGIGHHVLRTRPDLVVKGTSRRPATPRSSMTRTDWNLIRQVPASLLLVGPQVWRSQPQVAVAVDALHSPDHPATLDAALVGEGAELADLLGGGLEIYHVLQTPPHLPGEPVPPEQKESFHAAARHAAHRLARRAAAAEVRMTEGRLAEGLARLVAEHAPDVLVMGAVARPRWLHSAASGTAAQLLECIACDLLVVKPQGFVSPLLVTED